MICSFNARVLRALTVSLIASLLFINSAFATAAPWSLDHAKEWQIKTGWVVGSNYIPVDAVNQLEMWQEATFNPTRIDLELGWAENLGMTTMRVFLHDLAWDVDHKGFLGRMDAFLTLTQKHHIRPIFVFFDSCWNPAPHLGVQPVPKPGVHNSQWVQSPGIKALMDENQYPRLKDYVTDVVRHFAHDPRILAWDLWNEPSNPNESSSGDDPNAKRDAVEKLLPQVFNWAREALPDQPLTSGVWDGNWSKPEGLTTIERIQLNSSDVISFHTYGTPAEFEQRVNWLIPYGRPLICTEYMARPLGSTLEGILPIAKKYQVSVTNWGFVAGKTQTYIPWDSWTKPYDHEPEVWFHDIFRENGQAYRQSEVDFITQFLKPSVVR